MWIWKEKKYLEGKREQKRERHDTADTDLLKMVPVEILLFFGNYFRTLQLRFWNFVSGIVFLHL